MNHILKILAYGIGGLALLVGSFVTYSALTGTPMHEMKGVGKIFPEKVEAETTELDSDGLPMPEEERENDQRSPRQVYETSATPLGAFALQDPFSAEELRALEQRLQTKLNALAERSRNLDERERVLDADREHIEHMYVEYVDLRTTLMEQQAETEAAGDEVSRDQQILEERKAQTYSEMAELFDGTKADDAAKLLTSAYGPEEAAHILVQLKPKRIRELIGAIHERLPEAEAVAYVKALQDHRAKK